MPIIGKWKFQIHFTVPEIIVPDFKHRVSWKKEVISSILAQSAVLTWEFGIHQSSVWLTCSSPQDIRAEALARTNVCDSQCPRLRLPYIAWVQATGHFWFAALRMTHHAKHLPLRQYRSWELRGHGAWSEQQFPLDILVYENRVQAF